MMINQTPIDEELLKRALSFYHQTLREDTNEASPAEFHEGIRWVYEEIDALEELNYLLPFIGTSHPDA